MDSSIFDQCGLAEFFQSDDQLKAHGIVCSPTAVDGIHAIHDSLLHLKRIMVG